MKYTKVLVCAWSIVILVGCGGNPVKETPEELYAMGIKRRVAALERAKGKEVQTRLSELSEDLGDYEKRSGAEHMSVYKELQTIQNELLDDFKQSKSPSNLNAKVQKMKTLADKLPGKIDAIGGGPNIPTAG